MATSLDYPETSPEINRNRGTSVLEPDIVSIRYVFGFFFFVYFFAGGGAEAAISQERNSCGTDIWQKSLAERQLNMKVFPIGGFILEGKSV